jgi:hypothetical protein
MIYVLYTYLAIGGLFGLWYGNKFIHAYIKKHNMPYPEDMPNLALRIKQAFSLGMFELIATIVSGLVWPLTLIEVIVNKGVKL